MTTQGAYFPGIEGRMVKNMATIYLFIYYGLVWRSGKKRNTMHRSMVRNLAKPVQATSPLSVCFFVKFASTLLLACGLVTPWVRMNWPLQSGPFWWTATRFTWNVPFPCKLTLSSQSILRSLHPWWGRQLFLQELWAVRNQIYGTWVENYYWVVPGMTAST